MSKYTTEVRFICENANGLTDSVGYSKVNEIIQGAIPKIFDFDFPIYDESYRNVLCSKILKHYYTREIGLESVGLWKLHLDMRLNEIMPYYNQLYKSAMIEFNPMYDTELTTTMDKDVGGTTQVNDEDKTVSNITDSKNTNESRTIEYGKTVTTNDSGSNNVVKDVEGKNKTQYGKTVTTEDSGNSSVINDAEGTNTTNYGKVVTTGTNGTGSEETSANSDTTQRDLYSDTPQGALDNVENETYLTNARKNITDGSGSSEKITEFDNNSTSTDSGSDIVENKKHSESTENFTKNGSITDGGNDVIDSSEHTENTDTYSKTGEITDSGTDIITSNNTEEVTRASDGTTTKKGETKISTTEDYVMKISGKNGGVSYSKMLKEFRETFINIDMLIIRDLSDLFMNLW